MSKRPFERITTQKAIIIALGTGVAGWLLMLLGDAAGDSNAGKAVGQLGSVVVATGTLSLLWGLWLNRSFAADLMEHARLAQSVDTAGLQDITFEYLHGFDWVKELKRSKTLDVFVSYGGTWRGMIQKELRHRLNAGLHARVILPDPNHAPTLATLARRFGYKPEDLHHRIQQALDEYSEIAAGATTGKLSLRLVEMPPLLGLYLFDTVGVLTTFTHRPEKGGVPTFVLRPHGTLFEFVKNDFEHLWSVGVNHSPSNTTANRHEESR